MESVVIGIVQAVLVILIAPLVSGIGRWMRAKVHTRKGPSIFQDYYDLAKLFKRDDITTKDRTFVSRFMPALFFGVMLLLSLGIPLFTQKSPVPLLGDVILILYLMALSRFFFSLAGIDTSQSYSGYGSIRELMVGTLVEPSMILALFVAALSCGSTNVGDMGQAIASVTATSPVAVIVAGITFALACYVELGKLPYDMAEAEQELQEGVMQEYSGPSLALMKMAMSMKQIIVVSWFMAIFLPFGAAVDLSFGGIALGIVVWFVKIAVVFFICALVENAVCRVRYKYMGRQTWMIVGLGALAFVFCALGI
jgi:hydrogenase-4 component C